MLARLSSGAARTAAPVVTASAILLGVGSPAVAHTATRSASAHPAGTPLSTAPRHVGGIVGQAVSSNALRVASSPAVIGLPAVAGPTGAAAVRSSWAAATGCSRVHYRRYGTTRLPVAGFCGRRMSRVEMVAVLRKAGWSWASMPNALATFMAESDGYLLAFHANRSKDGRLLSTDVSWTQINDRYHQAVKTVNYADPVVAARFAWGLARRYGLKIWMGYRYRGDHMGAAVAAIRTAHRAGVR